MSKRTLLLCALLIAVLLVAIYLFRDGADPATPHQPTLSSVRLALDAHAVVSLLPLVADAEGYWEDEGLIVEVQSFTTGRDAAQSLLSGNADFATMADFPFVLSSERVDPNLRILASIARSGHHIQVLGNANAEIQSTQDLVGQTVGATAGTAGQYALETFLQHHGIESDSYRLASLSPPELVAAATDNTIAAIATWQPFVSRISAIWGDNTIQLSKEPVYELRFCIVGPLPATSAAEESARAFMRGLKRAESLLRQNQSRALEVLAEATSLESDLLESMLPGYSFALEIDPGLSALLADEHSWLIEQGILPATTQPREWSTRLDDRFIPAP